MKRDSDIGRRAVDQGLVTPAQVQEAVTAGAPDVGAYLATKGYLSWDALRRLKRAADEPRPEPAAQHRFGKFTLLRELGRGGMGVVWEARDEELGRKVALKLLRGFRDGAPNSDGPAEEERFLRFTREALTAAKLQHPNIVKVFEVSVQDGVHFIAMEYIEGRTLADAVTRKDAPLPSLIIALRDAARAVHYAHEQGILHRDLKPENILLSASGHAFVTDFGLARDLLAEERVTVTGVSLGTPPYMSPEHVQGSKLEHDRRSDVYSLGAVLYEVLTGRPPFAGETATQILLKVLHDELVAPRAVRPDAPVELETICLRAMRKEKEARFDTAAAFADDLDRFLQGEPVLARRPSVTYRVKKKILKHRGAAFATAAALLLLGGWMTTLLVQSRGAEGRVPEPAKAPPTPPPKPPLSSLVFEAGRPPREAGLRLRTPDDEKCDVEVFDGTAAARPLRSDGQSAFLLLDVDDAWASQVLTAEIEIQYFDAGPAWSNFAVEYDSTDERWPLGGAYKRAGLVVLEGARKWRTARFILSSPRLENRMDLGTDLRIGPDRADLLIHRVDLRPWTSPPAFAAPPSAVDAGRLRPGLAGEYHADVHLSDPRHRAVDADLVFDWQEGSWKGGPPDRFSIRWDGGFLAPRRGRYLVEVQSDDGSKVFLGGKEVVSNWTPHPPTSDVAVCDLDPGFYPLRIEYFEGGGHAYLRVTWFEERDGRMRPVVPPPLYHLPGGERPGK